MRYCLLASGSRGNSIFVESGYGRVLVDVGLSAKQIEERLKTHNIEPESIDAIVVTHAHGDHVRGVGVFANRFKLPIHAHPDTLDSITRRLKPNADIRPEIDRFLIKDISFTPFRVSHDCDPTVGFMISVNGKILTICTDLGVVTNEVRNHVRQAHALILESNHDPDMLMSGPYPWDLKERIAGRTGHLSNHNAGELLQEILAGHLQQVVLGHLSLENNQPELAVGTVLDYIGSRHEAMVDVVVQKTVSDMYTL